MNTMSPNKLNQAQSQVAKLKGVKIPSTIKTHEKGFYHLLIITSKANQNTLEFDHNVIVQIVNKESFAKGKDTYKQLGYTKVVIFHNPIIQAEGDAKIADKATKEAKAQAVIDAKAELVAEAKAELVQEARLKAEKSKGAKAPKKEVIDPVVVDNGSTPTPTDK